MASSLEARLRTTKERLNNSIAKARSLGLDSDPQFKREFSQMTAASREIDEILAELAQRQSGRDPAVLMRAADLLLRVLSLLKDLFF
jgi:hypothetical protein